LDGEFVICRLAIGHPETIEITEAAYNDVSRSRSILSDVTSMEEKFFAICEHYREVEQFVLSNSLNNMIFRPSSAANVRIIGAQFGRLTSSFLSSVRLYGDSVYTHLRDISGGKILKDDVVAKFSEEYDQSLSYRVLEAIRNHAQHRAFPVHSAKYNSKWTNEFSQINFTSDFYFEIEKVANDKKFKKTVKDELILIDAPFDLKKGVREYFASICRIHEELRSMIAAYRADSIACLEKTRKIWSQLIGKEDYALVAACNMSNGILNKNFKKVYIDSQLDEYRQELERKTSGLANMDKRVVMF